jgi:hypothetical protein
VLGVVSGGIERGQAQAIDEPGDGHQEALGVAEARALVTALEARVRLAEGDLNQAKDLLARLERRGNAAPSAPSALGELSESADTQLEGVWRIVSIGGHFGDEFRKPPYDEYKIMTAGHYLWLSFDPETGEVIRSGGGTYTLDGDRYAARVDYSRSDDLKAVVGQEYSGTCKVDGNKCHHYGHMPNGAVFDELWERVH